MGCQNCTVYVSEMSIGSGSGTGTGTGRLFPVPVPKYRFRFLELTIFRFRFQFRFPDLKTKNPLYIAKTPIFRLNSALHLLIVVFEGVFRQSRHAFIIFATQRAQKSLTVRNFSVPVPVLMFRFRFLELTIFRFRFQDFLSVPVPVLKSGTDTHLWCTVYIV